MPAAAALLASPLLLAVLWPLVAAITVRALGRLYPRAVAPAAAVGLAANLLLVAVLWRGTAGGAPATLALRVAAPGRAVAVAFAADGLAVLLLLTTALLALGALALRPVRQAGADTGQPAWEAALLLAVGAMNGLALAATPPTLVAGVLGAAIGVFAFVQAAGGSREAAPLFRLGAYWSVAAALLTVAVGLALVRGGSDDGFALFRPDSADRTELVWLLLAVAALALAGLYPGHAWRDRLFAGLDRGAGLALTALLTGVGLTVLARLAGALFDATTGGGFAELPPRYGQVADLWLLGVAIGCLWASVRAATARTVVEAVGWAGLAQLALTALGLFAGPALAAGGAVLLWFGSLAGAGALLAADAVLARPEPRLTFRAGLGLDLRWPARAIGGLGAMVLAGLLPWAGGLGWLTLVQGLLIGGRPPLAAVALAVAPLLLLGTLRSFFSRDGTPVRPVADPETTAVLPYAARPTLLPAVPPAAAALLAAAGLLWLQGGLLPWLPTGLGLNRTAAGPLATALAAALATPAASLAPAVAWATGLLLLAAGVGLARLPRTGQFAAPRAIPRRDEAVRLADSVLAELAPLAPRDAVELEPLRPLATASTAPVPPAELVADKSTLGLALEAPSGSIYEADDAPAPPPAAPVATLDPPEPAAHPATLPAPRPLAAPAELPALWLPRWPARWPAHWHWRLRLPDPVGALGWLVYGVARLVAWVFDAVLGRVVR